MHWFTDFALLEPESCILKFLLHVALAKEAPTTVSQPAPIAACESTYRSPPFRALLQSDSVVASSDSDLPPVPASNFSISVK